MIVHRLTYPKRISKPANRDDVLQRCTNWHSAFAAAEIAFPARLLTLPSVAEWLRGCRVGVEVRSADELAVALRAVIPPDRLIFCDERASTRTIWHAVGLGVGRLVVATEREILTLSAIAQRRQRVLLDITDPSCDDLVDVVLAQEYLDLIGVRCQVHSTDDVTDVDRAVRRIAAFLDYQSIIVSTISLAIAKPATCAPADPHALSVAIEHALADSARSLCSPSPSVDVSVDWQTLMGTSLGRPDQRESLRASRCNSA